MADYQNCVICRDRAAAIETISRMLQLTILTEGQLTYLEQLKKSLSNGDPCGCPIPDMTTEGK